MNEYVKTIKRMLEEEKFKELSNKLYKEVNKKYRNINIKDATQIVEINLANILVIGVERARDGNKKNITKLLTWYNLGSKSQLLEKNFDIFENKYIEYINLVINKVKEDNKKLNGGD